MSMTPLMIDQGVKDRGPERSDSALTLAVDGMGWNGMGRSTSR